VQGRIHIWHAARRSGSALQQRPSGTAPHRIIPESSWPFPASQQAGTQGNERVSTHSHHVAANGADWRAAARPPMRRLTDPSNARLCRSVPLRTPHPRWRAQRATSPRTSLVGLLSAQEAARSAPHAQCPDPAPCAAAAAVVVFVSVVIVVIITFVSVAATASPDRFHAPSRVSTCRRCTVRHPALCRRHVQTAARRVAVKARRAAWPSAGLRSLQVDANG
jgi:hypothetical protein